MDGFYSSITKKQINTPIFLFEISGFFFATLIDLCPLNSPSALNATIACCFRDVCATLSAVNDSPAQNQHFVQEKGSYAGCDHDDNALNTPAGSLKMFWSSFSSARVTVIKLINEINREVFHFFPSCLNRKILCFATHLLLPDFRFFWLSFKRQPFATGRR